VSPFKTLDRHAEKLRSRIGPNSIPATYILLIDNAVAGSVSLLDYDDIPTSALISPRGSRVSSLSLDIGDTVTGARS
jgi:hypothetical protein